MIKRLLLSAVVVLLCTGAEAQFDTGFAKKNIIRCADSLVKGFRTKNWELFALYTNPVIIGTLGGKDTFVHAIGETFATVPSEAWKMYKPGKILQVVKMPHELQAVVELQSVIEWDGKRITATSYLIGQSWDGGLNWNFFDSQSNLKAVKTIKPDISPDIVIPPKNEKAELINGKGQVVRPQQAAPARKRSTSKKRG